MHAVPWLRLPFEQAYRQILHNPSLAALLEVTPTLTQFDDHEVQSDFGGSEHPLYEEGLAAFERYFGRRRGQPRWYSSTQGDFDFFVLDCRTHRSNATSLGLEQREAVELWVTQSPTRWKIVASPISWSEVGDGPLFPRDRDWLVETLANSPAGRNCRAFILSGDLHFGAHFSYKAQSERIVHEFAASPFQALPFPPPEFAGSDHIKFLDAGRFYFGEVKPRLHTSADDLLIRIWTFSFINPPSVAYEFNVSSCGC